ncbi:MAG: SurA N-terminal domain-containing protein [Acidobacteria bacterium]|nr:SurA N-terminal domain-containing protein [Acidobacteriota bacterium]
MKLPIFGLLLLGAGLYAADVKVMEQIVAKVNGEIITRTEIDRMTKGLYDAAREQKVPAGDVERMVQERAKDLLREKIDQMLLVQKGKELNINVDPDVTKQIARIQQGTKIADQEKFQQFVKEQTGMSFEDYKAETKNQFLTRRVIGQEVSSKVSVSRAEAQKYYDEHKAEFQREERVFLREIFLGTDGKDAKAQEAVEKKAKDLVSRARRGEKFGDLARENSESEPAQNEGELPPYKKGELLKAVEDVIWPAPRNTAVDPIKRPNGWLLLFVEEHHQAGLADFEEVQGEITNKLYTPRMEPAIRAYLTQLRQEAFLEIREGFTDTGAAPGKSTKWTDPAQLKPETITKEEVAMQVRKKRLLWAVPVPGTAVKVKSTSKS